MSPIAVDAALRYETFCFRNRKLPSHHAIKVAWWQSKELPRSCSTKGEQTDSVSNHLSTKDTSECSGWE